jgi:DNA-binding transcriptional regulator YdaS (Cro superfamily)
MSSGRKYTPEQKDQFFAVLDRVGSVTAAAAELGLNRMTCYQWTRKAGFPPEKNGKQRPGKRKYTQDQKEQFFVVLDLVGSVAVAIAELGLNANTCYQWASKACLASRRPGNGRAGGFPPGAQNRGEPA